MSDMSTEQRTIEQKLHESEARTRAILNAIPDMMFRLDRSGTYLDFHDGNNNQFIVATEALIGTNIRQAPLPASVIEQTLRAIATTLETGRVQTFESTLNLPVNLPVNLPGGARHYESRIMASGPDEVLAIVRDISKRKRAEAEVQAISYELEQRVAERTRELTTLLTVMQKVNSTLELTPLLRLILDQLQAVVDYSGAAIFTLAGENELKLMLYTGPIPQAELRYNWPFAQDQVNAEVIRRRQPVIIPDVHADTPLARAYQATSGPHVQYVRTWMGVPLIAQDQVIGMLGFDYAQPNYYTARHAELALAFASQAAIAIENARLYEQTRALASLEERQKLARELHDSVSQALYGIALGARTARALLDRDPSRVAEPLDYVLSLAEAGLTEMRALIFELRPESLEKEGLVAALSKQAEATRARYQLQVQTHFDCEPALTLEVKQALYRIAQEALHNTVKHAQASQVELRLLCLDRGLRLEIKDNGIGFDPQREFPGHLGLRSMRERVERIGGTFTVESKPGEGTRIVVFTLLK